uniref:Uncharacterized protein n=1 Tax=Tanacetum cinerariifolium TaxID=118510 RepID=A0A699HR09_TANCI|nr:hypothetical protein [Tanacetum cinerariifolium]
MWSMRETKEEVNVYQAYASQKSLFTLKLNYACIFTESPGMSYVNEDFAYFNCIDIDEFFVHEEMTMMLAKMVEYSRLGYKMIEAYIEHDKTIVYIYIDVAYNAPFKKAYDFDPFFGLDSELVAATTECVGKGKRVALDDEQVHVVDYNEVKSETKYENRDGNSNDTDELVDEENELVNVEVDMVHFNRANANTMRNEGTHKFNAD